MTTGLLQKANDNRLRVVLAHQDLSHVAKTLLHHPGSRTKKLGLQRPR